MPEAVHLADPSGDYQCLHEFIPAARAKVNSNTWGYLIGATETETTMRRNRMALDSIAFRPRVCRDVSQVDCTTNFLGMKHAAAGACWHRSDRWNRSIPVGGAAAGAAHRRSACRSSSVRSPSPASKRVGEGDAGTENLPALRARRRRVGRRPSCIARSTPATTRSPSPSIPRPIQRRERDIAARFVKPWRTAATGHSFQASFNWDNVKRFKDKHTIPLILKGIATAEDAATACEHGVDVVYVSNHGGRQLDHGRGAMDVLPEVLNAVRRPRARGDRRQLLARHRRGEGDRAGRRRGRDGSAVLLRAWPPTATPACIVCWNCWSRRWRWRWRCWARPAWRELDRSFLHLGAPVVTAPHVHSAIPAAVPDTGDPTGVKSANRSIEEETPCAASCSPADATWN